MTQVWQLHELAIKAAPLILIAVGLAVCFRSNVWNIGAEGQFIMGAVAGSVLPVLFPETIGWRGAASHARHGRWLGGAAYAAIPAFLKARFNTNEILTSLMLVYVAQLLLDWLVRGPWRDPQGYELSADRAVQSVCGAAGTVSRCRAAPMSASCLQLLRRCWSGS